MYRFANDLVTLDGPVTRRQFIGIAEQLLAHDVYGPPMTNPDTVSQYLRARLALRNDEHFAAVWLTTRHRVIQVEELFHGSIDGASVHPRVVVRRGLELNAAAVIFAHNHPSGDPEPSQADRLITQRLQEALAFIEIRVLDHFVVGQRGIVSFASRGWV